MRGKAQSAAKRAEAQQVRSDPLWIRHLNRNQCLVSQVYAYATKEGKLTDNGHESKSMKALLCELLHVALQTIKPAPPEPGQFLLCQKDPHHPNRDPQTNLSKEMKELTQQAVLEMLSHENEEMLSRPAIGISERSMTAVKCMEVINSQLHKKISILDQNYMREKLAPVNAMLPSLEKLVTVDRGVRGADLNAALKD
jgi:hypothetical protein